MRRRNGLEKGKVGPGAPGPTGGLDPEGEAPSGGIGHTVTVLEMELVLEVAEAVITPSLRIWMS
jgi:hypothetical protein